MQVQMESLESRTLLSGWTTVEDYNPPGGAYFFDIAADSSRNLYVAGHESGHPVIRQKLAGQSGWSTIYSSPDTSLQIAELATNAAGDLYAAGHNASNGIVMRRAAGESTFATIDSAPDYVWDLAVDGAGDVFTVGTIPVITKKGKTGTTAENWAVRKQTAGQGAFATVDQFVYSAGAHSIAKGITIVEGGPNAGIYVVGQGQSTTQPTAALVRKSTNGGTSWTTTDTFRYQGPSGPVMSTGEAITADSAGNVYVSGVSAGTVITRKSTNGGGSFAIVDAAAAPERNSVVDVHALVADHADNVYVVGMMARSGAFHGYVRSNVGGTWATVDDVLSSGATSFHGVAVDPAGSIFVSGMINAHGIVRTNAPPAAAAPTAPTFSTTAIAGSSSTAGPDPLLDVLGTADDILA